MYICTAYIPANLVLRVKIFKDDFISLHDFTLCKSGLVRLNVQKILKRQWQIPIVHTSIRSLKTLESCHFPEALMKRVDFAATCGHDLSVQCSCTHIISILLQC